MPLDLNYRIMGEKDASSHDKGNLVGSIAGSIAGADVGNKIGLGRVGGIASSILGSGQGSKLEAKLKDEADKHNKN